jgi:type I restriction-modification system DNA methylase subunit
MATPTPTNVDGISVLLYTTGERGEGMLEKALCIAPPIPSSQDDALVHGILHLPSPCVECLIIARPTSLHVQDLVGIRSIAIDEGDFDDGTMDCICRYLSAGHVVFLDPVFVDAEFIRHCWSAFSSNIDTLKSAGFQDRDECVRAALQVVIDLCIDSWKIQNLDLDDSVTLAANFDTIDHATLSALNAPWRAIPGLEARLDERILCHLMEQSIMSVDKKRTGSYYTPRAWAWYTCHEALLAYGATKDNVDHACHLGEQDLQHVKIIDPAMGSGDFLDAMSLALVDAWLPLLARSHSGNKVDWNAIRLIAKLEHVFKHNLHGIDVNKIAVDLTRVRFFLSAIKHVSKDPSLGKMMAQFTIDLVHDDFLTRKVDHQAFDIVVGNPPYLMEVRNNQALFRHYSKHPVTRDMYEPKMDLFYFFMFKGIEVLRDNGVLGFVVQEYWLDRFHAKRLRQFIFRETAIVEFTLFKKCKVFPTAPGQHTMIVVARRKKTTDEEDARIITVQDMNIAGMTLLLELLAKSGNHVVVHHTRNSSMYDVEKDKVFVSGAAEQEFIERIHGMEHHTILEDEIQVGINIPQPFVRTGGKVEGVFVVPRDQAARIAKTHEEQAILKPFHKATDIDAYAFSTSETHFIIYTTNENMKRVENEHEAFARVRAHLDKFAGVITSDHKPYGLHRPRQQEWFESREKIIGVRKTRSPKFAVVPQDYYMDQAALFIKLDPARGIPLHYACAFLNSSVAFKVFSSIKTQGGQLQIDKNVLTRLPIPACHALDYPLISTLSKWMHVFGILEAGRRPLVENALSTRLRHIIDRFFEHLVKNGHNEPILSIDGIGELPNVDSMEHLESTVVNIEGLRESIMSVLPSLELLVDQLEQRSGC